MVDITVFGPAMAARVSLKDPLEEALFIPAFVSFNLKDLVL